MIHSFVTSSAFFRIIIQAAAIKDLTIDIASCESLTELKQKATDPERKEILATLESIQDAVTVILDE